MTTPHELPPRGPRLARSRLTGWLDDASSQVTVITAPAGYGKTTLVQEWARTQRAPVAIASFDVADRPPQVHRRLLDAVVSLGSVRDEGAWSSGGLADDRLRRRFLEELVVDGGIGTLVLDGIDSPSAPQAVEELGALAVAAPPDLRVIVTRRGRRPESVDRIADADPTGLDARDLAFTADEIRGVIDLAARRHLDDRQVLALQGRTEGWPVGVVLAATRMRSTDDLDACIAGISGDSPAMARYFEGSCLGSLSTAARQFLRFSAVVSELNAPLADALTWNGAGAPMLALLERRGAFLRRLPGGDDRVVIHPLLRSLLRHQLRLTEPGVEDELLRRAARWHAEHGDPERAAPYLIEASAWDELVALAAHWGQFLFERGRAQVALDWLEAIPPGAPGTPPQLPMLRAFLHTMVGRTRLAAQDLHELETSQSDVERLVADALRSTWVFVDAPPESTIEGAESVLGSLDAVEDAELPDYLGLTTKVGLRTMAMGARARARWSAGDIGGARPDLTAVFEDAGAYPPWQLHCGSALSLLEAWAGNLTVAARCAERSLQLAADADLSPHASTLDAHLALAHVWRERNDLSRTDELLEGALTIAIRSRRPTTLGIHAVERACWHLANGTPDAGLTAIADHRKSGYPPPAPMIDARLTATEIRLWLACGDSERAQRLVAASAPASTGPLASAAVECAVARNDLAEAARCLEQWTPAPEDPRSDLERELWRSIVDLEAGKRRAGVAGAVALLAVAQEEGHVRLFLDIGRPAERLLRAVVAAAPNPYAERLLQAADSAGPAHAPAGGELSERELEIIRYLPTPLTTAEIAERLYISLNTLKTHLRSIYRKLDVAGRNEASARAQELGLA